MEKLILFSIIFTFSSCSSSRFNNIMVSGKSENKAVVKSNILNISAIDTVAMDSVVIVQLSDEILLRWSNQSHSIIKDSLFSATTIMFRRNKAKFINLISDKTETRAKVCSIDRNLLVGDIAFILIKQIKELPYFKVFGIQLDAHYKDCQYPAGLFDYINQHRDEAREKVRAYIL